MIHLLVIWCAGLLMPHGVPFAGGQGKGEKAMDPPKQFYSKPVRVGDADFEVVANAFWGRPADIYGVYEANIGLRISNRSDKDLTFDLGDTLRVSLKLAEGSELVTGPIPKRFLPKPLKVAAAKSETVTLPTQLFHTRIGEVCLGLKSDMGWNWLTRDILPGKYLLCLTFEQTNQGNDAWRGKVQTEALEIEIKAAK